MNRLCQFRYQFKSAFGFLFLIGLISACAEPASDLSIAGLRSQSGTFPYETVPSRSLDDLNASSSSFESSKSATDYQGSVSVWYFTHASCAYCRSQYALLDQMQKELDAAELSLAVDIVAVNAADFEAGIESMSAQGDLPLLQDLTTVDLWGLWKITYRDVVVVNPDLVPIATVNLTTYDLATEDTYQALKNLILDVVEKPDI